MFHRRRGWVFVLLPLAFPLAAQQVASDRPLYWQADAKLNKQAQKVAEKAAKKALPATEGRGRGKDAPADGDGPSGRMGGPGGGGSPPDGGAGNPPDGGDPGGGGGGPGPGGGARGGGRNTAASMLRDEMDFAAPLKDTLILYRSRDAVVFGRKQSQDVVILPLSGAAVEFAPGERASVHEEDDGLRVDIVTSNDIRVNYRYLNVSPGELRVKIHAEGPVPHPGSRFDVERSYRLDASAE